MRILSCHIGGAYAHAIISYRLFVCITESARLCPQVQTAR